MNRWIITAVAAVIMVGTWSLLKARIFVLPPQNPAAHEVAQIPHEQVLWTAENSRILGTSGEDPRAVFANGLTHFLQDEVSGASAWPSQRELDPAVISVTENFAHVKATVRGVEYHGILQWGPNGWQLIRLSRES